MHISWSFLDKRKATIEAIEAYDSMKYIIENTDDDIRRMQIQMEGLGSVNLDGMPHAHDPGSAEERIAGCIDEIDVMKERYRQAVEYMEWFRPAWEKLSEDDRYVLEAFYSDSGGSEVIQNQFNISQSSAYNKKNRALDHMMILLYGKT